MAAEARAPGPCGHGDPGLPESQAAPILLSTPFSRAWAGGLGTPFLSLGAGPVSMVSEQGGGGLVLPPGFAQEEIEEEGLEPSGSRPHSAHLPAPSACDPLSPPPRTVTLVPSTGTRATHSFLLPSGGQLEAGSGSKCRLASCEALSSRLDTTWELHGWWRGVVESFLSLAPPKKTRWGGEEVVVDRTVTGMEVGDQPVPTTGDRSIKH